MPFFFRRLMALFCATILMPVLTHAAEPVEIDRVIAVVNDEVVTQHELRERVQQTIRQLERDGEGELPPRNVLERQLLERLILEHAQLQRARTLGLKVDDDMLSRAIERIATTNNLSEDGLRSALTADGISWERYRKEIRKEITLSQLREHEVDSEIKVSDAEIDNFVSNNPDAFSSVEMLISHILIRVPELPTQTQIEEVESKVRQVMARLGSGDDFGMVAAALSNAPDALEGGSIGWRSLDRLPALYAEEVKKLKPGQISLPIRSGAGVHVIKLMEERSGNEPGATEIEQTHVRHILLKTSEILSDSDAESRLLGLRERIVHGADFTEIARVNSSDMSAASGGDLGWINPGDTVPDFERAMNKLAPNEVSMPVKSPFGWHLIEVIERRKQDVSGERKRNAVRAALHERKVMEAFDEWLRRLRDETYVEYRLEDDGDDE